jgi:hypothetical protein
MSERERTSDAERQQKCRRGTRSDLRRILEIHEELREVKRTLEILTAPQAGGAVRQDEQGQR